MAASPSFRVRPTALRNSDRPGPGGRIYEDADDGPVADVNARLEVDGRQQRPALLHGDFRRFAVHRRVAFRLHRQGWIEHDDVPLHEDVEEEAGIAARCSFCYGILRRSTLSAARRIAPRTRPGIVARPAGNKAFWR
jgi:hypothetical protein